MCLSESDGCSGMQFTFGSLQELLYSYFKFCAVLCSVAGILGARGYGAGKPGRTSCKCQLINKGLQLSVVAQNS